MDPRIAAGTTRMLERRRRELDDGATHLGWKAGFGALAGNIFHRHVLLGPEVEVRITSDLGAEVERDDTVVARTDEPEALTGDVAGVLASMADTLAKTGGTTAAGDVVITGSVVPPVPLSAGLWAVTFTGLGEVTVRVTP